MATIQRWIDSSISKTCNVPNEYTVDEVRELYMRMYRHGCKGGTIYRDKSRNEQVQKHIQKVFWCINLTKCIWQVLTHNTNVNKIRARPYELSGKTYRRESTSGPTYITTNKDKNDELFEVFFTVGKV